MRIYIITPVRIPTSLGQAVQANKRLDKPLTKTEKRVLYVLMKSDLGEIPDEETRKLILWVTRTDSNQWARIVEASPDKAEIVEAINNFFFGNLIDRCIASKQKEIYHE